MTEDLLRELPKGLVKWYEFQEGLRALVVSAEEESARKLYRSLKEALEECALRVDTITTDELESRGKETAQQYDYIVCVSALERCKEPEAALRVLRGMLAENGKLLLGMDNRLGIRYFCGDRDAFTGHSFDGIENYMHIGIQAQKSLGGRAYARMEIAKMLENTGFGEYRFYSAFPEITSPQVLYAEDYLPEEELEIRIFPQYNYPDAVFLEEERLYRTLIQNGLFHTMANGYLIECSPGGEFANVKHVTLSMERGRENALCTIIRRDEKVVKKAIYAEGKRKLQQLVRNHQDLSAHGVKVVSANLEQDSYVMPYVHARTATDYFRNLLKQDKASFLCEMDRFWEIIQNSSEEVAYEKIDWERFEPGWQKRKADDPGRDQWKKIAFGTQEQKRNLGRILKRGYIDLVSLNCFWVDGDFVFFDQEFVVENLPAKVILQRTIDFIYRDDTQQLEALFPKKALEERYYLTQYRQLWNRFADSFLENLRNEAALAAYHTVCRRDPVVLHENRHRINYSAQEYERLFHDIFRGTQGKQIYLFGSGNFAKTFLSRFLEEIEVAGILDNDAEKWNTVLAGIPIYPPEYVKSLEPGSYKVIVCIKNYEPILRQLLKLGVRDYAVYDSTLKYPSVRRMSGAALQEPAVPKKYHVGYIAGVFDLFHIGHLNMFKRAKEQCDYLIVGVVSDESVMSAKRTMPFVPFEERMEMVRACRYVDEAVAIPPQCGDTDEAYRRYRFDVQFSGSDYENDPYWLAKKAFLQKQGADMVFFPYTQSTSSTKLKALIEKGLL